MRTAQEILKDKCGVDRDNVDMTNGTVQVNYAKLLSAMEAYAQQFKTFKIIRSRLGEDHSDTGKNKTYPEFVGGPKHNT